MRVGTVAEIWRYPVKSMGGERMDSSGIGRRGIPGDRGWAIFDEERDGITNGKRLPRLRECRARYAVEPVAGEAAPVATIAFPDGAEFAAGSPEAYTRLQELTGRRVSMRALGPAGSEAAPRVSAAGDTPEDVRRFMGILPGETEPDYSMFTPERLRQMREGNFFDAFPLHLISRTTLATLKKIAPGSDWDERRFRANLIVELDEQEGYPEHAWSGRRLRVGGALLEVAMGCPRCVMVTLAETGLPRDPSIMRTLVRETRHIAGSYLDVVEAGEVRPGDTIELLDTGDR